MSNFEFCKNSNLNEIYGDFIKLEKNINNLNYNFGVETRIVTEKILYLYEPKLKKYERDNLGKKLKVFKIELNGDSSIIDSISSINIKVKKYAHDSGGDSLDFMSKKSLLKELYDLILNCFKIKDTIFDDSIYIDVTSNFFKDSELKLQLSEIMEEQNADAFNSFELLTSKYLIDMDEFDFDSRVIEKNDYEISILEKDTDDYSIKIVKCHYVKKLSEAEIKNSLYDLIDKLVFFSENDYRGNNNQMEKVISVWNDYVDDYKSVKIFLTTPCKLEQSTVTISKIKEHAIEKFKQKFKDIEIEIFILGEEEIKAKINDFNQEAGIEKALLELSSDDSYIRINTKEFGDVILAVINASSLKRLFEIQKSPQKLFSKNVRGYIKNKKIDTSIQETLKHYPEKFLILNNGLTIVGNEVEIKNTNVIAKNLFIVNGGQTTSLIGNYKDINNSIKDVKIFVKIIDSKNENLVGAISEASNNQKPIKPVDLLSNNNYINKFIEELKVRESNYFLLNKRSESDLKSAKDSLKKIIKLEDLMKIYFSFVKLMPGTSRSGFSKIVNDKNNADLIFKKLSLDKDRNYDFFTDLMFITEVIEEKIKKSKNYFKKSDQSIDKDKQEYEFTINGKQWFLAVIGAIVSSFSINEQKKRDLEEYKDKIEKLKLGSFINWDYFNKNECDFNQDLDVLLSKIEETCAEIINSKIETTPTNFLKTDRNFNLFFNKIVNNFGAKNSTEIEKLSKKLFKSFSKKI